LLGSRSLLLSGGRLSSGCAANYDGGSASGAAPDAKNRIGFWNRLQG
jgi:hypothetical protein